MSATVIDVHDELATAKVWSSALALGNNDGRTDILRWL
jgi:hypothetical protein